jgi:4'-phosphopantetheinyl transferase
LTLESLIDREITWQKYTGGDIINKEFIHIFKISTAVYEQIENEYKAVLSTDEINKASRFMQVNDSKLFIVGKYFLRYIIGKLRGIAPSSVIFSFIENKKPATQGINFNVSHSGNYVVIGISTEALGVDIEERVDMFDYKSLLSTCFTKNEIRHINEDIDFYTFWTRKEAILKATGEGLIDDLLLIDCVENEVYTNDTKYRIKSHEVDNNYLLSIASSALMPKYQYWALH